jgi:acyl dehydratase
MARIFDSREDRYGRYFDDFEIGDTYKHWPGKTITESDDHLYCLLTMAGSPLHIDSNYASTDMSDGKNLVIGTYIYALLTGMSVTDISGKAVASLGVKELNHIAPVFHGDTLYASTEILEKRVSQSNPKNGILTVRTTGRNQDAKKVCSFIRSVLLPIKGAM